MDLKYIVIVLAQILVILGIIYLVGFALSIPTVVENFKVEGSKERNISPQKMATLFAEINENTKDSLNISKHRAAYQDALAQIQENVNLAMLQTLSGSKSTVPKDKDLEKIQKLQHYKNSVSELEEFLDAVRH
jgi:threonyl-tRNA synthetase